MALVSRVNAGDASASTTVASPSQTHTAGNLLVVCIWSDQSGAAVDAVLADTAGNTFTHVTDSAFQDGVGVVELAYAHNCLGHASNVITATFDTSSTYRAITVLEFDGFGASDPFADSGAQFDTDDSLTTGTLTGTGTRVMVAAIKHNTADITGGSGFTFNEFGITGEAGTYWADQYKIATADEAATATASGSASGWILGASFNSTAATNLKITALTALTDPILSDLLVMSDDPGGTAVNKKFTIDSIRSTFGLVTNVVVQTKTVGSGTYTPTSGMVKVLAIAVGPGGDGAGGVNTDSSGGGGGGGATCIRLLTAANIGASKAYVVGGGGTGTATTLDGGTLMSAGAGSIGTAGAGSTTLGVQTTGGAGGTASAGDLNIAGHPGGKSVQFDGTNGQGGRGGASAFGFGGAVGGSNVAGSNGQDYGGGGAGGHASATANRDGGTGADGVLYLVEFLSA